MQIQRISDYNSNNSFTGFRFKDAYAKRVFDLKLKRCPKENIDLIKNTINKSKNEPANVIINATKARTVVGEHILFATFSNNENLVVEKSRMKRATRLEEFIKKCAVQAGYKLSEILEKDDAQKMLELADDTLNIVKK